MIINTPVNLDVRVLTLAILTEDKDSPTLNSTRTHPAKAGEVSAQAFIVDSLTQSWQNIKILLTAFIETTSLAKLPVLPSFRVQLLYYVLSNEYNIRLLLSCGKWE